MEEKEERIFIRKGTAIELCKFIYRDGCAGEMHCCNCAISIPRPEAIEKMAKAICASNMAPDCLWECETCDRWKGSDKEVAEAALNALLGGHDDEK